VFPARDREQGGVPIVRHQNVAYRLFHMYRKVEAARALARRAMLYNFTQPVPALQVAMASKITGTQAARSPARPCRSSAAPASAATGPSRKSSGTPACR
jgi:alkylation response protein AidB-like acyl-CoA dehydrogenase